MHDVADIVEAGVDDDQADADPDIKDFILMDKTIVLHQLKQCIGNLVGIGQATIFQQ